MKNKMIGIKTMFFTMIFILRNNIIVFAAAPGRSLVESIVIVAIEAIFGFAAAGLVVLGGFDCVSAFLAHRESDKDGGSGEASSKVGKKIIDGIFCFLAATMLFIIMGWLMTLFDLN